MNQMIVRRWHYILTIASCDAAEPWQLGFQDAATPMMQGIIYLHHDIFFFLIIILVFVLWMLVRALRHFHYRINPIPQRIVHGTTIEIIWTIFPSIILMFIAIPSFALLYSMDEVVVNPAITIKAIGHQWYWTYEYSDYNSSDEQSLTFDSYMIPEDDLELGQLRLLEVDNRVVVPARTHLRMIVTSADVLHSWAVPSLGVKCDAVPGRLNQTSILVQREGVYYGQCSEICGTNHAFMRFIIFSQKSLGKAFKATFDGRIGAIQKELQQFLNPNEVVFLESNEQQQSLRISLRSITPEIVESLLNEMARCAPKCEKTVQAVLCRNLNVKLATLLNAISSRRIRLRDDIVTGFHFSVSEKFVPCTTDTKKAFIAELIREGLVVLRTVSRNGGHRPKNGRIEGE